MNSTFNEATFDSEGVIHPSGDLILPVILDPAVAAQVRLIAERWGSARLSEAVSDLLLTGLIHVNSTARAA